MCPGRGTLTNKSASIKCPNSTYLFCDNTWGRKRNNIASWKQIKAITILDTAKR